VFKLFIYNCAHVRVTFADTALKNIPILRHMDKTSRDGPKLQ